MENYNFDELVDTWIEYQICDSESKEAENCFWAVRIAYSLTSKNPEELWRFTLGVLKRDPPPEALCVLAAGPLEDLLAHHGPAFRDRIEKESAANPKFKELLGGVWESDMEDEIWKRMQAVSGEKW